MKKNLILSVLAAAVVFTCGYFAGKPSYAYRVVFIDKNYEVVGQAYVTDCITNFAALPIVRDEIHQTPFRPIFAGLTKIKP